MICYLFLCEKRYSALSLAGLSFEYSFWGKDWLGAQAEAVAI